MRRQDRKIEGFIAVVYDLNGREAAEAGIILDALPNLEQYIFCSSAGVYKKSDEMPHREVDEGDPKSRHKVLHAQNLQPLSNKIIEITSVLEFVMHCEQ